jgi:hypothetical protein
MLIVNITPGGKGLPRTNKYSSLIGPSVNYQDFLGEYDPCTIHLFTVVVEK